MLQIKKVLFNKSDFAYTIEYFDGKDVRRIATNDEALNSMKLAIGALENSIKDLFAINDYSVRLNAVTFGKNEDTQSTAQLSIFGNDRDAALLVKIHPVSKTDKNPDGLLVSANVNVYGLKAEVEKYINGERAQQEMDFSDIETEIK